MTFKKIKKKIKFYLGISFIISLIVMLKAAFAKGALICGLYYAAPCPIIPWIFQLLMFTVGVTIIMVLLVAAVKAILNYIPEIAKRNRKPKKDKKEVEKEIEKQGKTEVKKNEKGEEVIKI